MVSLILSNLLHVIVEGGVEAGVRELLLGELCQSLAVEGVLKMLQSQSIVENVG